MQPGEGMWVREGEDDGGDKLGEGSRGVMGMGAEGRVGDLSWDLVTTQMLDDSFSSFSSCAKIACLSTRSCSEPCQDTSANDWDAG